MLKTAFAAIALTGATFAAAPAFADTTASFTSAPFAIPDGAETTSALTVSGLDGSVTNLTLSLNLLGHTYPDDLVFGLLNETAGVGFVFMSGAGGSTDVSDITLTFSDAATSLLPESFIGGPLTSGTYLPSNYLLYEFTNFTNVTSFAGFNGLSANGTWTLYALDTFAADTGEVRGGWTLNLTTDAISGAVPEPATWALMILGFGAVGGAMRRRTTTRVRFA